MRESRKRKIHMLAVWILLVALVMVLAACGQDSQNEQQGEAFLDRNLLIEHGEIMIRESLEHVNNDAIVIERVEYYPTKNEQLRAMYGSNAVVWTENGEMTVEEAWSQEHQKSGYYQMYADWYRYHRDDNTVIRNYYTISTDEEEGILSVSENIYIADGSVSAALDEKACRAAEAFLTASYEEVGVETLFCQVSEEKTKEYIRSVTGTEEALLAGWTKEFLEHRILVVERITEFSSDPNVPYEICLDTFLMTKGLDTDRWDYYRPIDAEYMTYEEHADWKLQRGATDAAKSLLRADFEKEKAIGYLEKYEFLDCAYVPGNEEYNVEMVYEAVYAGDEKPMLTASVTRRMFMQQDKAGSWKSNPERDRIDYKVSEIAYATKQVQEPGASSFVAKLTKDEAAGMSMEEIGTALLIQFIENLKEPGNIQSFRLTDYRNVKMNLLDTGSAEFSDAGEDFNGYYGQRPLAEGALNSWIGGGYEWKFVGAAEPFGYRGAAICDGSAEDWWEPIWAQSRWFVLTEWPDKYTLQTSTSFYNMYGIG